jgi:deazaflavin-dependent oxidoreductase (nitroreductase family)
METYAAVPRPPLVVRLADSIVRRLLKRGLPVGPNTLLTVRGRTSGEPRSVGIAVVEIGGRRWIVGAYGDVHWVRNLRAAGEGELLIDGRTRHFQSREYDPAEAIAWFRGTLIPNIRSMPFLMRLASSMFARDILRDPDTAAIDHPVFELRVAP